MWWICDPLDPEFKSHLAVELIPGGVDSACHLSAVGKMSTSLLISCVGVATCPGLCPIAKETSLAASMLCTEYGPNGMDGWTPERFKVNSLTGGDPLWVWVEYTQLRSFGPRTSPHHREFLQDVQLQDLNPLGRLRKFSNSLVVQRHSPFSQILFQAF